MDRRAFLKSASVAGGLATGWPFIGGRASAADVGFSVTDLHCHLTPTFTIDHVMEISRKTGVRFGIVVNPGGAVSDDAGQGLKFTFGSDTRDQKAGRLDYCKYIAKKCGLKSGDFFVPKRALNGS